MVEAVLWLSEHCGFTDQKKAGLSLPCISAKLSSELGKLLVSYLTERVVTDLLYVEST